MGFGKKTFSFIVRLSIQISFIVLLIILIPWLPPNVKVSPQRVTYPKPIDSNLQKKVLNDADILAGKLSGPESFVEYKGNLYTGIDGGEILQISPQHDITTFVKIGKPCDQKQKCSKPLGLKIANDNLYVADAYDGIWKISMLNGSKEQIVSPYQKIDGVLPKFFNNLAVASNGDVFWSHSSLDFDFDDGAFAILADGSGRLIHYKASDKTNRVLLTDLWFANGVALSPNEEFVIISESCFSRIRRYFLKGTNMGQSEIFIDGLPGMTDNFQVLPHESGFLISIYSSAIDPDKPLILHSTAPLSWLRKFALRVLFMIQQTFITFNNWYPHEYLVNFAHKIGSLSLLSKLSPKSIVCYFDWDGNLQELWYGDDDSVRCISDVIPFNGKLYMGSPINNYIAVVTLPESIRLLEAIPVKPVEFKKKAKK